MIQRDMEYYMGGGALFGGLMHEGAYNSEDEAFFKAEVLKKHPKAYMYKSTSFLCTYQIREPKMWFWSRPIGNCHLFEDQAWASAYVNMCEKAHKNN